MSEATTRTEGLSSDIQRLVDAVASLAEATVRPAVRTLDTLGSNIGRDRPRVQLSGLGRAGTSLLSSSIQLAERLSSLALELVEPRGRGPAGAQVIARSTAQAGETLSIPMAVSNPGPESMKELAFEVVRLGGPSGSILAEASPTITPATIAAVAPGDFEKITMRVNVPVGSEAGPYEGGLRVTAQGSEPFEIPFQFELVG